MCLHAGAALAENNAKDRESLFTFDIAIGGINRR
jgi:hypothetical protein